MALDRTERMLDAEATKLAKTVVLHETAMRAAVRLLDEYMEATAWLQTQIGLASSALEDPGDREALKAALDDERLALGPIARGVLEGRLELI